MIRIYRFCLITGLLLAALGCSTIDIAYNNAQWLAAGEIDDAFDLDNRQSDLLEVRLEQFFDWHRHAELARYQDLMETSARQVQDGINAEEFLIFIGEIRSAWRRSLGRAIDSFADLAADLSPEQIENYRKYYAEKSEEKQEYLAMTAQQRTEYRVDRSIDRLEDWFGNFDRKLEQRIAARLALLPDMRSAWIEYRQSRDRALIAALAAAPGAGLDPARVKAIMLDQTTDYARAFESERLAYWRAYAEAIEEISGWLSEKQHQKAADRLLKYARAMARLQKKKKPRPLSAT